MSAFFGMIQLDGKPVDRDYLEEMACYLARIGPDQQSVWTDNGVGMVHALSKTTATAVQSQQPYVSGRYVVVGDVRLDDRERLLRQIGNPGLSPLENRQDIELVLRAWLKWGQDATDRLIGDFSVAIWDRQDRKLFCFRDQMGIKQFFYSRKGSLLLFSSALNGLRRHEVVSSTLNDQAVVDFLVFGFYLDFSATIYNDIHRLPPAHAMEVSHSATRIHRYWMLPVDPILRYRNRNDYVEQFRGLLKAAVRDRLSVDSIGVSMSGGLDSTAVAGFAREVLPKTGSLSLYTLEIPSLWPDDREAEHAKLVADRLGATHHVYQITADDLFEREAGSDWLLPEPSRDSFWPAYLTVFREMALSHRTALTGHGADPLLMSSPGHFCRLIENNRWGRFLVDTLRFYRVHHHRPPLGLRGILKRKYEKAPWRPGLPNWLKQELVEQTHINDRLAVWVDRLPLPGAPGHPERPEAYRDLSSPIWPYTVLRFDSQTTGLPIEFRHPFLDLRVMRFALAMPASPWFYNKELLRRATRCVLPDQVRQRQKSMPGVAPVIRGMRYRKDLDLGKRIYDHTLMSKYVNVRKLNKLLESPAKLKQNESDLVALPIAFFNWLSANVP